ncbi:hypothetical protein NQ317_001361 [Molorchus minor]|uniref:C2H2-type domain-containing protein n=1 Tax=Molorchus minor TaxID=1323400 RepID=A0ABQ9J8J3_9CUCU|nr:hypothetical protein NQ317_001361 [Molorchus minor]
MHAHSENICRLCLQVQVLSRDYKTTIDCTKEIFNVLLLDVTYSSQVPTSCFLLQDLSLSEDRLYVTIVQNLSKKAFDFKSTCICTEELVVSFTNTEHATHFYMKEIYKENKELVTANDNVCRFCMECSDKSNFMFLDNVGLEKMLSQCLPELDYQIIIQPVICASCMDSLKNYFNFVALCEGTEEKIQRYCLHLRTDKQGIINLNSVLVFISKGNFNCCKQEGNFNDDDDIVIKNEELDICYPRTNSPKSVVCIDRECLPDGNNIYKCNLCEYASKAIGNFKRHRLVHMDKSELDVFIYVTYANLSLKQKTTSGSIFQFIWIVIDCKCIPVEYTKYKSSLKSHLLIHKDSLDVEMYSCAICDFKTRHKTGFRTHILKHKDFSEVKAHQCGSCKYRTKIKWELTKHLRIHEDDSTVEMYRCNSCKFKTRLKCSLKRHLLVHIDQSKLELHKCEKCEFQSKYSKSLMRHQLLHKDISQMKMHTCKICGYGSRIKCNLVRHLLVHKEKTEVKMHRCELCPFETKHKGSIKKHLLTHKDVSESEKYKCQMCDYQSKWKGNLKQHLITHEDSSRLKVYTCKICGYKTKYRNNYVKHLVVHKDKKHRLIHRNDYEVKTFGHATEIDILPLEDYFQSCVEGGYTYRRHRTHNHSLNRCQLFRRESNPPNEAR